MARTWHYFPYHLEGEIYNLSPFKTFVGDYQGLLRLAPEVANQPLALLERYRNPSHYSYNLQNFLFVPGVYPAPPNKTPSKSAGYQYYHSGYKEQGYFDPTSSTGVWISYYDIGTLFGDHTKHEYDIIVDEIKSKRYSERMAKKKASEEKRAQKMGLSYEDFKIKQKADQEDQKAKRRSARLLSKFMIHTSELGKIKSELEQAIKTLGEQRYSLAQSSQMLYSGRRLQSLSKMLKQFAKDYTPQKRRRY